jgi:hypothetical protein
LIPGPFNAAASTSKAIQQWWINIEAHVLPHKPEYKATPYFFNEKFKKKVVFLQN